MKIYQLSIGPISQEIESCIESVKKFASKGGEYVQVNQLPEEIAKKYGSENIRNLSDFWKIDILCKPRSMIVDYDVILSKEFSIKTKDFCMNSQGDFLISNGNKTRIFKLLQKDMDEHFVSQHEVGALHKSWNRLIGSGVIKISEENIITKGFIHLENHKRSI